MISSKKKSDQRFIDMIILQYAKQKGIKFGFKGFKKEDDEAQNEKIEIADQLTFSSQLIDNDNSVDHL